MRRTWLGDSPQGRKPHDPSSLKQVALDRGWTTLHVSTGYGDILGGTAALDAETGEFGIKGVPVAYERQAPTVPGYLRLDEALAGETELATDYDYVFYNRAHLVRPLEGAEAHGELRRALFDRTWEHFTSHAQAPVGEPLDSPLVVEGEGVLYFAAPLFGAYRDHDY